MNKEINKIISWIEMSYTRLNYKEELLLVNYIKQLQQENKELKEHIEKYEHYCKTTGIEEIMKENKQLKEKNEFLKSEIEEAKRIIQKYKEVIDEAIKYIESKNNGHCIINGEEKGAFTFILNFDAGREFIWKLLDILKGVE